MTLDDTKAIIEYQTGNFIVDGLENTMINNQRLLIQTPPNNTAYNFVANTINNIECIDLLQEDSKYEIVYDNILNKYKVKSNKVIYDIKLSEDVNSVDLPDIIKKLDYGKIYILYVNGTQTNSSTFYFGSNIGGYLQYDGKFTSLSFFMLDSKNVEKGNLTIYCPMSYGTAQGLRTTITNLVGNETITASGVFGAGTRIIIKEVA